MTFRSKGENIMKKAKERTFTVSARIVAIVTVEIEAGSIEQALDRARALTDKDFVSYEGELLNGSGPTLVCVSDNEGYDIE